ncbi:molybdopterin binding domain-containing protein [Blastomyces gilchristii SLH14081]|uniref:Molybdopterin binding domain-containing protein n=1 Tax=Blastomyces gilchristii (strain SLH14081) TaxID=559298 RepID=A0A179U9L2_BLAGS|nr:molybdopterin binding domain-containing protein [Blastomyces gilchristii SLH14081]OAT04530.1 molybdopterin binding domain-containing protein [Blastomyces gilchristii SLH14081]
MIPRINQLVRRLSRPRPNSVHIPAATAARPIGSPLSMTSYTVTALANSKKTIRTAACLIIGDEVLGGKTVDTNSPFFAKYCFSMGVSLKRIEVIADDESEIIEAVKRMSEKYDFVVTSGGIGPTHDDITYQSIARAFGLKLKLHEEALARMRNLSKPQQAQRDFDWDTPSPALTARLRMVKIPVDEAIPLKDQALFVADDLWLPVSIVNGNVYILPGVPLLFERLCNALKPLLQPRLVNPDGDGMHRLLFATPLYESTIAPYLTELAARVEPHGIKVGSYPRWGKKRNTVTLVGKDLKYMESLIDEVEKNVEGRRVMREDEDDPPEDEAESPK